MAPRTWLWLDQALTRKEANLDDFFKELGSNSITSAASVGREKRAVERLKTIHTGTTALTNGAVVVACVLMGKTKLASKELLPNEELLSWYEAHRADQVVLWATQAFQSRATDFTKHLGPITIPTTSSDSPDTQRVSHSLRDVETSGAFPQVQVDAAGDAPHTQLNAAPYLELNNTGDASYIQPSSKHLHTSIASLHAQTQFQSMQASVVGASTQVPSSDIWACEKLPTDIFLQVIEKALVCDIQPEAVFHYSRLWGFNFWLNNKIVGQWRMFDKLQVNSEWEYFGKRTTSLTHNSRALNPNDA